MAPEMLRARSGKSGYTFSVDWWALGTLIYELLIGMPPFYHHNQHRMEKMIKKKKFVFPDQKLLERDKGIFVSDNARDLIEKLLIKEPENRLGSKKGMEEVLAHPWFSDIDRILMMNKKIKPEFIPKVKPDKEILKES